MDLFDTRPLGRIQTEKKEHRWKGAMLKQEHTYQIFQQILLYKSQAFCNIIVLIE